MAGSALGVAESSDGDPAELVCEKDPEHLNVKNSESALPDIVGFGSRNIVPRKVGNNSLRRLLTWGLRSTVSYVNRARVIGAGRGGRRIFVRRSLGLWWWNRS